MKIERLVTMANQIGAFFETMPDRSQAQHDVADHLRRSWDPRMRQLLLDHIGSGDAGGSGLTVFVYEALAAHRDALLPRAGSTTAPG